jgi:thiosulfate/3-mercaptopyruvate sulfurtransferase
MWRLCPDEEASQYLSRFKVQGREMKLIWWSLGTVILVLLMISLLGGAKAAEYGCPACQDTEDSNIAWLRGNDSGTGETSNEILPGLNMPQKSRVGIWKEPVSGFPGEGQEQRPPAQSSAATEGSQARSQESKKMLVPAEELSGREVLLDVSDNGTEHIEGSLAIPYTTFEQSQGLFKPVSEVARILGDAGISRHDDLVIYSQCSSCGAGPWEATYIYWMMRSLGHEKVRVLDGTIEDWKAAGLPFSQESAILPKKTYEPEFTDEFIASYDYVKDASENGTARLLDVRDALAYAQDHLPMADNRPYQAVLQDNRIKNEEDLKTITFKGFDKESLVVVYTKSGQLAALVWFALEMVGFESKVYSLEDWAKNEAARGNNQSQEMRIDG